MAVSPAILVVAEDCFPENEAIEKLKKPEP